jgi:hypothetical protein
VCFVWLTSFFPLQIPQKKHKRVLGTPDYVAPEILLNVGDGLWKICFLFDFVHVHNCRFIIPELCCVAKVEFIFYFFILCVYVC